MREITIGAVRSIFEEHQDVWASALAKNRTVEMFATDGLYH
jgi:hypothetical protein